MHLEVKSGNRTATIEIMEQNGSIYKVKIDNREYKLDIANVSEGIYSIIHNNKSINMEMIAGENLNSYRVNTSKNYYELEVVDARTRYLSTLKSDLAQDDNIVTSPMPGKIVKIQVNEGDTVEKGQTVIVVSAMKMESEYKSPLKGTIKHIFTTEGETIVGHQPLIEITPSENE